MFRNYFVRFIKSDIFFFKILFLKTLSRFIIHFIKRFYKILFVFACTLLLYANVIINNNLNQLSD